MTDLLHANLISVIPFALKELQKENTSLKGQVHNLQDEVHNLEVENKNLRLQVRALELAQARASKPDDDRQCHLDINYTESVCVAQEQAAPADQSQAEPTIPTSTTKRKGKRRVNPAAKFEHLPITEEVILIPEEVKTDPEEWVEIAGEITYEVLVQPTRLTRRKIERKKFVKRGQRQAAPIIAKAPIRFCASYISSSLAVYIVLNKYLEHGALHRLERKFDRLGADIARQCQSDAIERFSLWIRPLYELIERKALASSYLQIDETFIKYINCQFAG